VEHARLVEGPEGGGSRPPRILLVEDDLTIRQMTQLALERDGFAVSTAHDGASGLAAFRAEPPDLVILDVMLPGVDGVSVCRTIREKSVVPIVMLTARTDPVDVVLGLEAGADDYVTKPFEPSILAARLRAVLRRVARHDASPVLRVGEVEIDRQGMEVRVGTELVSLTPTEYRLLLELAEHSGAVLSRERLLEEVWGYVWAGDTRLVDMHVRRLRAKIGPETIETVRGAGYKLVKG
jgi:DNA-binding response OmpR family regulator